MTTSPLPQLSIVLLVVAVLIAGAAYWEVALAPAFRTPEVPEVQVQKPNYAGSTIFGTHRFTYKVQEGKLAYLVVFRHIVDSEQGTSEWTSEWTNGFEVTTFSGEIFKMEVFDADAVVDGHSYALEHGRIFLVALSAEGNEVRQCDYDLELDWQRYQSSGAIAAEIERIAQTDDSLASFLALDGNSSTLE